MFRTMAISLSFSSPFLSGSARYLARQKVPSFSGSARYLARREVRFFSGSAHVERPVSFQALLCGSTQAESNTLSRVLRYFARGLVFFFS